MKELNSTLKKFFNLKILAFLAVFSLMAIPDAEASHYRFGSVSWVPTGGNTIEFTIRQAWRGNSFGSFPSIGDVENTGERFWFGDGSSVVIELVVLSVNPTENWFFGEIA